MKFRNFICAMAAVSLAVVAFQNCGQSGFQAKVANLNSFSSLIPSLPPSMFSADKGLISAKFSGKFDANCLNDSSYDACLFWKNPVATRGAPFSSVLQFGTSLPAEQSFGVRLTNLADPNVLGSTALNVYWSGTNVDTENRLRLQNGQFRRSYAADGSDSDATQDSKSLAQLMAYYWLNHLQVELKKRTGTSFSENVPTNVDAYAIDPRLDSALQKNAFFTFASGAGSSWERYIVMGYAPVYSGSRVVRAHEMALSAEVYVHEMGHANLFAAKGNTPDGVVGDDNSTTYYKILACTDSSYKTDPSKNIGVSTAARIEELNRICDPSGAGSFDYVEFQSCNTNQGCFTALNEGQADFHYLMIFPDATALGETIENNMSGFKMGPRYSRTLVSGNQYRCLSPVAGTEISRNVMLNQGKTVEQFFQSSALQLNNCSNEIPGEIHGMGSAYATALWEIYIHPKIDPRIFEKAFQAHLQKLGRRSDFSAAWMAFRSDYLAVGGDLEGQKIIDEVFSAKGVEMPKLL